MKIQTKIKTINENNHKWWHVLLFWKIHWRAYYYGTREVDELACWCGYERRKETFKIFELDEEENN